MGPGWLMGLGRCVWGETSKRLHFSFDIHATVLQAHIFVILAYAKEFLGRVL
jgi:F0F1-type ATP synthase membrane subunit a